MTVVFANQRCVACGQTGDPRLMSDCCHRSRTRGHPGQLQQRFTRGQVYTGLGLGAVGTVTTFARTIISQEWLRLVLLTDLARWL